MKITKRLLTLLAGGMLLAALTAKAQEQQQPPSKASLGIGAVNVSPSVTEAAKRAGTANQLSRIVEAMDGQLMDRMQNTRKFTLVSRSDLKEVLGEQALAGSGNIDKDDQAAAKAFKLKGCQYLVVSTVDNFQDYVEKAEFAAMGESATRRIVQYSVVAKIYDTTTGKLLESTNLQLNNTAVERNMASVQARGDLKEELYTAMARAMSQKVADRVVDVLYPAKIIAKTDKVVTINRGDGTNVAAGQVWDVFAVGAELKDPDTGAVLGREEVKVGSVKITDVRPLFSQAEVMEDRGVNTGTVLRLVDKPQASSPQPMQSR